MSMNLMTGYAGQPHVTAAAEGACTAGIFGSGRYVLNVGEMFNAEVISNNLIRIKSGYAINQGRKIELALNDYEELTIDNGLQGVKRCDIIAIRYEKNSNTGIEDASLVVIKGTSGDDYSDPDIEEGDIIAGDFADEMPLYRVKLNGISIEAVEQMFSVQESANTFNKIRTFGSLGDLGMSYDNSLDEIMAAMPRRSVLMISTTSGVNVPLNASLPATQTGMLLIETSGSSLGRGQATYKKLQTGETWINEWYNGTFIGWKKMVLEEDMPLIQSGSFSAAVSGTAQDITVTFEKEFSDTPAIQVSNAVSASVYDYNAMCLIKSISKKKVVFSIRNISGTGSSPCDFHWLAIGK